MSADGRLIIREEEDASAKMEEEEGAKGGCPRGRGQGCMHLLMRPFTHHSVGDCLWGSIGENRYKELVSKATFF